MTLSASDARQQSCRRDAKFAPARSMDVVSWKGPVGLDLTLVSEVKVVERPEHYGSNSP